MKSIKAPYSLPLMFAVLLAGGGILAATAHATSAGMTEGAPRCEARQSQDRQSRMEERRAQHLAALKEKLKLAPAQEAAWNSFAAALQPGAHHAGRQAMGAEPGKLSTPERLDRMQAMAEMRRARMAERAKAIKAFYAQLTPEQQKVFDAEAMPGHHGQPLRHHT